MNTLSSSNDNQHNQNILNNNIYRQPTRTIVIKKPKLNTNFNKNNDIKKIPIKKRPKKLISAKNICLNLFLALIFISTPLFFVFNFNYPGATYDLVSIDGEFSDWDDKIEYMDDVDTSVNPDIDIIKCKAARNDLKTSFYVEVKGEILKGHRDESGELNPDIVRIFIDGDKDINTGYMLNDIGADYMIEIQGENGEVIERPFYVFDPTHRTNTIREQNDWCGWRQHYSVEVSTDDNKLEAQIGIPYFKDKPKIEDNDEQILAVVQTLDTNNNQDVTDVPISNEPTLLIVNQKDISPDVLLNDISKILELEFTARGTDIVVKSIKFTQEGGGSLIKLPFPISIQKDKTVKQTVELNCSSVDPGLAVKVRIDSSKDIITNNDIPIKLVGTGAAAYVKKLPNSIRIDGLFADWTNIKKVKDSDNYLINNSNINLLNYAFKNSGTDMSFYIDVEGVMLEGSKFPNKPIIQSLNNTPLSSSTSEEFELPDLPESKGEDTIYIFLDCDNNKNTGYGPWLYPMGADQVIEIIGQNGKVTQSNHYKFNGGQNQVDWNWSKTLHEIPVGISKSQLESQITHKELGTENTPNVYYYVMDWTYLGDFSNERLLYDNIGSLEESLNNFINSTQSSSRGRGINTHMVINEIQYTYNNLGAQFIELFNPTSSDIGEDFTIYRLRGPQVTKILTLIEDVASYMCSAWNPDTAGFGPGDMLILKDASNKTVDVIILPHTLDSGDSYQRYVDKLDGKPIDTGGNEEFFSGDFYTTDSVSNTINYPNLKSKAIPELHDFIIPIILIFIFIILVRKSFKKSKNEML